MTNHAPAPDAGRNVHCICGAEYSLATNLRRHIELQAASDEIAASGLAKGDVVQIGKGAATWRIAAIETTIAEAVLVRVIRDLTDLSVERYVATRVSGGIVGRKYVHVSRLRKIA